MRIFSQECVNALDCLAENELVRMQDQEVQRRARERSGVSIGEVSNSMVSVGLYSAVEQQEELIRTRKENCVPHKLRKIGQNAACIGQQADGVATHAMHWLMRVFGETVDTLYYPGSTMGQPTHNVVMMMLRTAEVSNKSGGCLTVRRTTKPVLTVYGCDEAIVDNFLLGISDHIQSRDDDTECPIDYNFVPMQSKQSMRSTLVECNNKNVSKHAKGSRLSETSFSIQEYMELQGRVHGMMSPALD
jgi:hypothetical protein